MKIPISINTIEEKVVDIDFPIYRKQVISEEEDANYEVYSKQTNPHYCVDITVMRDNVTGLLEHVAIDYFNDMPAGSSEDYQLGLNKYSSSQEEFNESIDYLIESINELKS